MTSWRFFNFGRNFRLGATQVCSDDDYSRIVGIWISGRIFGLYINIMLPNWGRK